MSDNPPPPPRRLIVLRTTPQILKQTNSFFSTRGNLLMFLLLSFHLLSLRVTIDSATHSLTSFIDNDPSIKSLIYRIHGPPNPAAITNRSRHRRRPFLQLTRVGTVDDDFFSHDDELDHRFAGNLLKSQINSTSFILDSFDPQLGFSDAVSDNEIKTFESLRSSNKLTFRSIEITEKEENALIDEINDSTVIDEEPENKSHRDFTELMYHVGSFYASYALIILGSVLTHASIEGITFVLVLNDFCRKYNSFTMVYLNGVRLGLQRLTGFLLIRWAIRDVFTQLLAFFFFGKIDDRYSLLKILVRANFMPFSMSTPWIKGFDTKIYWFVISWLLLDMFMSFIFAVDDWILMADPRKTGKEAVKEGYRLLRLMRHPAINLKCFEGIICGPFVRIVLARIFGTYLAIAFQSFMEVYFMVAWLVYYLSVKSIDANCRGQTFGQRELKAMLEDVR